MIIPNNLQLRKNALLGHGPYPVSRKGRILYQCRHIRGKMAWMRQGSYAWLLLMDDLKAQQRYLAGLRTGRMAPGTAYNEIALQNIAANTDDMAARTAALKALE